MIKPASDRLQIAIVAYRDAAADTLDEHGSAVLDRLAADDRASGAFESLAPIVALRPASCPAA